MVGGRDRDRTGDPLLAKQVLSQLSYTPTREATLILKHFPPFRNPVLRIFVIWSEPLDWDTSVLHTLRERSCKVERKKGERYSKEFRQQAVERMNACDNISRFSRELGVARHLLYYWRDRLEHKHPPIGRQREFILRKQILALKRVLANKTMEVDFFRRALQRVGARRRQRCASGGEVSTTK
jgi:transposase-like protein